MALPPKVTPGLTGVGVVTGGVVTGGVGVGSGGVVLGGVGAGSVGVAGVVGEDGAEETVPPVPQPVNDRKTMPIAIAVRGRDRQRRDMDLSGSKDNKDYALSGGGKVA